MQALAEGLFELGWKRDKNLRLVNEENVRTSQQETNKPWKKPGKSDYHPTKDRPNPRPRTPEDNKTAW